MYLQYHGGTNFGRTTSALFIATSYDYDAPLDEYGMENKASHITVFSQIYTHLHICINKSKIMER